MNRTIWKRIIDTEHGLSLGSCILLQGILMAVSGPLLPIVISNRIGLDKPAVTAFYLLLTLMAIVITLGSGYLSDGTIARYKLVLIGGALCALGYLGIGFATQPLHAFIAVPFIVGIAVMFPQLFAVARAGIVGHWERDSQVMGITALRTLYSLGFILGTALSSWLVSAVDIQAIFFLLAGGALALTLYAVRVLYRIETAAARQATQAVKSPDSPLPSAPTVTLPLYALIVPLIAVIVLQGADSTRQVYLSLVMFQMFGDASIAPLMFGLTATVELITLGLLGYLSSRVGEGIVIAGAALVGAVYFVVMSFTQALPVLYGAQVVYAVFVAAMVGIAMAYIQNLLVHRAGLGGSLYVAVINLGSLVGILTPLLVTGYDQQIFIIPAILCVVGAVLLLLGDRTARIKNRLSQAAAAPAAIE